MSDLSYGACLQVQLLVKQKLYKGAPLIEQEMMRKQAQLAGSRVSPVFHDTLRKQSLRSSLSCKEHAKLIIWLFVIVSVVCIFCFAIPVGTLKLWSFINRGLTLLDVCLPLQVMGAAKVHLLGKLLWAPSTPLLFQVFFFNIRLHHHWLCC